MTRTIRKKAQYKKEIKKTLQSFGAHLHKQCHLLKKWLQQFSIFVPGETDESQTSLMY